ncbi:MAG: hypothetical protein GC204_18420 [Chloroflexi bacterium]|nr:hypothetical protein [Chloroflexota bacterium]
MPVQSVFQWLDGRGWLVFSGGGDDEIRATALARMAADGAVACVSLTGDPDHLLDDIADLGAPTGYLVDVYGEDDATLNDKLSQSGMVIIAGGEDAAHVRGALRGAALEGVQAAYANGAIILLEGYSATAFGSWLIHETIEDGLEWLVGAAVLTNVEDAALYAKPIFAAQPEGIAVNVRTGSALALGPDGQIERWGEREVTIVLGPAYGT